MGLPTRRKHRAEYRFAETPRERGKRLAELVKRRAAAKAVAPHQPEFLRMRLQPEFWRIRLQEFRPQRAPNPNSGESGYKSCEFGYRIAKQASPGQNGSPWLQSSCVLRSTLALRLGVRSRSSVTPTPMDTTPVSLLLRIKESGDQVAWRRLVEFTTPLLFSWAHAARLQGADAADLVQEVLTVLVQALPTFDYDRDKSFRGWLRTITLNKYREQRRRRAAAPPTEGDERFDDLEGPPDIERYWDRESREQLVARALEVMRSEFHETTWKACWEAVVSGRSAAEIAAELGITQVAVWSAKSKVLRRLREELKGLMD